MFHISQYFKHILFSVCLFCSGSATFWALCPECLQNRICCISTYSLSIQLHTSSYQFFKCYWGFAICKQFWNTMTRGLRGPVLDTSGDVSLALLRENPWRYTDRQNIVLGMVWLFNYLAGSPVPSWYMTKTCWTDTYPWTLPKMNSIDQEIKLRYAYSVQNTCRMHFKETKQYHPVK